MNIDLFVRVAMVVSVSRRPPNRPALYTGRSNKGEDELHESRGLKRTMGKIAMIERCDGEHMDNIHHRRHAYRDSAPANVKHPETHQVNTEVRNQSHNVDAIRICFFIVGVLLRGVVEPKAYCPEGRTDSPVGMAVSRWALPF